MENRSLGEVGPFLYFFTGLGLTVNIDPSARETKVCMVDDPVNIYPKWQPQVMAALWETNPDNLREQVKEAEKAIAKRFEKISRSTSHAAEIEAIEKAMDALDVLRTKASQPKAS